MNRDYKFIDKVNSPADLKSLDLSALETLAGEIRKFLISSIAETGGHLSSNLGIVELTIAIHKIFDSPKDKIVWDVGHQSYVHKILTGRRDMFGSLRKYNGISGFTKISESEHDAFGAGHSSTSLSAAAGIAAANEINGIADAYTIAIVGDGSFTGGLIYEALNNSKDRKNFIVILNDNEMSISKNVGSVADYLAEIRTAQTYFALKHGTANMLRRIPFVGKHTINFLRGIKKHLRRGLYNTTFFEQLGFDFLGPVNGHNIKRLISVLKEAKLRERPVFIHVKTQKGKGYERAELSSVQYHSVGKFDIEQGLITENEIEGTNGDNFYPQNFSVNFGKKICDAAKKNQKICAITAAMTEGTGLARFRRDYPGRFFDVGIAEEHAAVFAAGLAAGGLIPVFAVYSSFLQRAYDQILHDAALQKLRVVFCVDRAGLVGEDGATHHGIFDVAFLNHVPDITIFSPSSYREFDDSFDFAVGGESTGPVVIRYPRGGENADFNEKVYNNLEYNVNYIYKSEHLSADCEFLIISYGRISSIALEVYEKLNESGKKSGFLKLNRIKPIGREIWQIVEETGKYIIIIEEAVGNGGIAEYMSSNMAKMDITGSKARAVKQVKIYAIDGFVAQGTVEELFKLCGFEADRIYEAIMNGV